MTGTELAPRKGCAAAPQRGAINGGGLGAKAPSKQSRPVRSARWSALLASIITPKFRLRRVERSRQHVLRQLGQPKFLQEPIMPCLCFFYGLFGFIKVLFHFCKINNLFFRSSAHISGYVEIKTVLFNLFH